MFGNLLVTNPALFCTFVPQQQAANLQLFSTFLGFTLVVPGELSKSLPNGIIPGTLIISY